tara:strand:+ start:1484 stop:1795 length:312 start_codon:yes stop_codon:yes gene_type:complete
MKVNEGDLLVLGRINVPESMQIQGVYALVVKKHFVDNCNCECSLLINGLERKSHIFMPRAWQWNKIIAHVFAPTRKEQKEKGLNIGKVWGDFDIIEIIKAKEK